MRHQSTKHHRVEIYHNIYGLKRVAEEKRRLTAEFDQAMGRVASNVLRSCLKFVYTQPFARSPLYIIQCISVVFVEDDIRNSSIWIIKSHTYNDMRSFVQQVTEGSGERLELSRRTGKSKLTLSNFEWW